MMLLCMVQHALYVLSLNLQNPDIGSKTVEKREMGKRELEIDIKTVGRGRKERRRRGRE